MQEIERKFITNMSYFYPHVLPNRFDWVQKSIFQFYIAFKPSEIRYRRVETHYGTPTKVDTVLFYKTIKTGEGLSRKEEESLVSKEEFYLAFPDAEFFISKTRYENEDSSIDFYPDGLSVLEIEYPTEEDAICDNLERFQSIIKEEVTGNKTYSNATLAKERYSYTKNKSLLQSIQEELEETNLNIFICALHPEDPAERDILPQEVVSVISIRTRANQRFVPSFYKLKKMGGKSASEIPYYGKKQNAETSLFICFSEKACKRVYSNLSKILIKNLENEILRIQEIKSSKKEIVEVYNEES